MLGQEVLITVIEKLNMNELVQKHLKVDKIKTCDLFEIGQEISYKIGDRTPAGFCEWAWADILKDIILVASRASVMPDGEKKNLPAHIACCTDGMRPVIFKIKAVD